MLEARSDGAPLQTMEAAGNNHNAAEKPENSDGGAPIAQQPLSKNAQKKLLKQQRYEAKKAEKKALMKEQKKREAERKRKEWEESLETVSEEERLKLIESRKRLRKERMEKRSEEKEMKKERLTKAKKCGQNVVIDLEFSDLMTPTEINSLVQQVYVFRFTSFLYSFLFIIGFAM